MYFSSTEFMKLIFAHMFLFKRFLLANEVINFQLILKTFIQKSNWT